MIILKLKNNFSKALQKLYPQQEIDNFFYLLSKKYLNLSRIDIALNPDKEINIEIEQKYNSAIAKLKKHTPIQYIIGSSEFYGLTFKVNKNVLIPRPETEELVSWVLKDLACGKTKEKNEKLLTNDKLRKSIPNLRILDIGTGSGCIAISIAKNLTNRAVTAIDISTEALKIAKQNALTNKVSVNFIKKDILKTNDLKANFDIIISNPPYVRNFEKEQMNKNVLNYEPHVALFVENDNALIFYDKIADIAMLNLSTNGILYFEINQAYGEKTMDLLKKRGFKNILLKKDIFGVDRMIKATKASTN